MVKLMWDSEIIINDSSLAYLIWALNANNDLMFICTIIIT